MTPAETTAHLRAITEDWARQARNDARARGCTTEEPCRNCRTCAEDHAASKGAARQERRGW